MQTLFLYSIISPPLVPTTNSPKFDSLMAYIFTFKLETALSCTSIVNIFFIFVNFSQAITKPSVPPVYILYLSYELAIAVIAPLWALY